MDTFCTLSMNLPAIRNIEHWDRIKAADLKFTFKGLNVSSARLHYKMYLDPRAMVEARSAHGITIYGDKDTLRALGSMSIRTVERGEPLDLNLPQPLKFEFLISDVRPGQLFRKVVDYPVKTNHVEVSLEEKL